MNHPPKHPSLYEINTRILLNSIGAGATIGDIPIKYWKALRSKGIDWVWLMGIWEIQEKALDPHLIPPGMMHEFRTLMPDITDDDISGSPYAIHDYNIDPDIGDAKQLRELRKVLHKLGMKLMLDFVPNHFGAHTKWLDSNPEHFVEAQEGDFLKDKKTWYRPWYDHNRFFAHGKDPYFDAWQDTVQVNYANPSTHEWMRSILTYIAGMCDGVRCDMAMLPVHRIFSKTWSKHTTSHQVDEFWPKSIATVKEAHPHFLFLAECYWDMEAELMEMGFDYCYDKVFYDRMTGDDAEKMRLHFHAEPWWLMRTARFLENHDEHRAPSHLHLQRHMAAAALVAFGPGMRFWHMGQWEGRRKKVPVQIHRYPDEAVCGCVLGNAIGQKGGSKERKDVLNLATPICTCVFAVYDQLLQINQDSVFREGEWRIVHESASEHGLICWLWTYKQDTVLVAINFSDKEVAFSLADQLHLLHLKNPVDVLSGTKVVDSHQIHTFAPWTVCVWKIEN